MAGVNKVILLGNLGSDPEVKYLEGGSVVARFNIATSEAYNNRNGERVEQTEWHRVELWDNLAKIAEQYLKKGNQVYIEGKIKSESWTDKDGQQRTGIRIRATSMQLVGSSGRSTGQGESPSNDNNYTSAPQPQTTTNTIEPKPVAVANTPPPFSAPTTEGNDDLPF
jgi:single-strand DNA-binding protein